MTTPITEFYSGQFELEACVLYNYNRVGIDIRHMVVEFNVYHDIALSGTKCELVMADGQGLIELFPIVGDETLVLFFRTPGRDEDTLQYVFRIHSVSNRSTLSRKSESYVLEGISQPVIASMRKAINRSYSNMPISTIVENIYNTFLIPTEEEFGIIRKNNPLIVEETKDDFHIVFTKTHPISAIRRLAEEAEAKNVYESQASHFIFFEKSSSWHFETLDSLMQKDAVEDFYFSEAAFEEKRGLSDKVRVHQVINSLTIDKQFDVLNNLKEGLYNYEIETIDPITKQFSVERFNYENESSFIPHLEQDTKRNPRKVYVSNSIFAESIDAVPSSFLVSSIGDYRKPSLTPGITNDPQVRNPRRLHTFFKYKNASRIQMKNAIEFDIVVPGNSRIEIGDIVNIHIPQNSIQSELVERLNLFYDKRFLVVAVRHTYNKSTNMFMTALHCVKDTYGTNPVEYE